MRTIINAKGHMVSLPLRNIQGFTLVELMISLVLGLLISAAVVQIYITNVRTSTVQKSGSELQDASVFGIQQLEAHIRLANLGNTSTTITDKAKSAGIVLTGYNLGASTETTQVTRNPTTNAISATATTVVDNYENQNLLTHSVGDASWTGSTNTDIGSDQLTIQFTNTTNNLMADCEGATIDPNATAIERYFIRTSSTTSRGLVLACDAGRVSTVATTTVKTPDDENTWTTKTVTNTANVSSFGDNGQEFIAGVDQFKLLLGVTYPTSSVAAGSAVAVTAGQVRYVSPSDYKNLNPRPAITAIKFGLIVRGNTPIVGTTGQTSFPLLGTQNNVLSAAGNTQVRSTYESNVLLRNARVVTP